MTDHQPDDVLEPVRQFADTVLEHGRDEYGDRNTPLFVDTLDVESKEPTIYSTAHRIRDYNPDAILSNPATYQSFLRTLVGLTRLTGDDRYRSAAADTVQHVFDEHVGETGLIQWGGHVAIDVETGEVVAARKPHQPVAHELKTHYPFYEFMWDVDPEATRRFIEAFWNAHVVDWTNLDFNRHGLYDTPTGDLWEHDYEGGDIFFMGEGLTFCNTGSDLYYAAGLLSDLADDRRPLDWATRLSERYAETRGSTGISGYQFSVKRDKVADGSYGACHLRGDRAEYQIGPYVTGDRTVLEGTVFRPDNRSRPRVERHRLLLGERLGDAGAPFRERALEELRALDCAYRPADNTFEPMLTDGYTLEGFVHRRDGYYGATGDVMDRAEATPSYFWTYALAHRLSDESFFWEMARSIGRGIGIGDIGAVDGTGRSLESSPHATVNTLYGCLELHRASGDIELLELATTIGRSLLRDRFRDGLFATDGDVAQVGDRTPLALLHLHAALSDVKPEVVPTPGGKNRWRS